ncbi:YfkD family protein, partial [Bacillus nitratireducens]|uniref:YfkD family protein n=1 Tax=Bacillus nitratireducens TaxID=2026193 RepID=UPI002848160C
IRMFNETTISNAPLAVGYRAKIYLGQWALNYESIDTSINWEYKQVNRNVYDNRGGDRLYPLLGNIQSNTLQEAYEKWSASKTAKSLSCHCPAVKCLGPNVLVKNSYYPTEDFLSKTANITL